MPPRPRIIREARRQKREGARENIGGGGEKSSFIRRRSGGGGAIIWTTISRAERKMFASSLRLRSTTCDFTFTLFFTAPLSNAPTTYFLKTKKRLIFAREPTNNLYAAALERTRRLGGNAPLIMSPSKDRGAEQHHTE